MGVHAAAIRKKGELNVNVDEEARRELLRRRLIRGVVLAAIGFAVTILLIGKNWNQNHTIGLIFGLTMMAAILVYASFLKSRSNTKD
jgi:Mg/Co/Ni transporter MgtE